MVMNQWIKRIFETIKNTFYQLFIFVGIVIFILFILGFFYNYATFGSKQERGWVFLFLLSLIPVFYLIHEMGKEAGKDEFSKKHSENEPKN